MEKTTELTADILEAYLNDLQTRKDDDRHFIVDISEKEVKQVGEFDWDIDGYILKGYYNDNGILKRVEDE